MYLPHMVFLPIALWHRCLPRILLIESTDPPVTVNAAESSEGTESRRRESKKKVLKKIEEKERCRSPLFLYRFGFYLRRITPSPIRPVGLR